MNVPPQNDLTQLALNDVVQRCQEETEKFRHRLENVTDFCFELFRRAVGDHAKDAITHVFHVYESLMMSWVTRHPQYDMTGEEAEHFVSMAFSNFYFALSGGRFSDFDSLKSVLAYLKRCIHTAISMHLRRAANAETVPLNPDITASNRSPEDEMQLFDIWERINLLLPQETDRILANSVFAHHLKPAQIAEMFSHWETAREVSVDLQRIRRTLRSDSLLRKLLGIDAYSD